MTPPMSDAELRFQATLDDKVSPKAEELEKRLKRMGATPAEIKMMLKAHDEATPRIKEVQKQLDSLPREHHVRINAQHEQARNHIQSVRKEAEKPIQMRFEGLEQAKHSLDQMFQLRSKLAMPSGMPGGNMLYGVGAGGALAGGLGSAALGAVGQGVSINAKMEQSMVTLTQTLKDQTKATTEMGDLVEFAKKTPFSYSDTLAADVRLRSYQIPTMKGEGGPGNEGWLKSAGDMAAAMSTPITQAVEAIADARQGYFIRMMSYGIRMMREDFEKGGKFAGLTYEQGLERAIKRFEGSMEMQSKTFTGIMSNIKDVMEQNILRPVGAPAFGVIRDQAKGLQDKLLDPDFQKDLGVTIDKITTGMIKFYDLLKRGKDYFDVNLRTPLTNILKAVVRIGAVFGEAFGGITLEVVTTLAEAIASIVEPIAKLAAQFPVLTQFYAYFKALSLLGFGNITKPFGQLASGLNPLSLSIKNVVGGLMGIPKAISAIGIVLLVKGFLDAHNAARALGNQFQELDSHGLDKLNADVSFLAAKLGESGTKMKELVAQSAAGIPIQADDGTRFREYAERRRQEQAIFTAQLSTSAKDQFGIDETEATKMLLGEASRSDKWNRKEGTPENRYSEMAMEKFYGDLGAAAQTAKDFGIKMSDVNTIITRFSREAGDVNLGGLEGAPYLTAVMAATQGDKFKLTDKQIESGIQSPTMLVQRMLQEAGAPSIDTLNKLQEKPGGIDRFLNFRDRGQPDTAREQIARAGAVGRALTSSPTLMMEQFEDAISSPEYGYRAGAFRSLFDQGGDEERTTTANRAAAEKSRRFARRVGGVTLPRIPDPYTEQNMAADLPGLDALKGQPVQQGLKLAEEIGKNEKFLDSMNSQISNLNDELNILNRRQQDISLSTEIVNNQMARWQHENVLPLQHRIEDMSLAMQEYSFKALRPLERQMTRLQVVSSELGNTMREAQYDMGKFASGLFDGEQAALNNLHALERYNKQLQLLQLQHQQMGAELGRSTYERGFSSRVEPLAGLSLQLQIQRAQRRQQIEQLKYEDDYGEKHYKLEQAGRSKWQRTEMGFDERMEGTRGAVKRIDETTEAQHKLAGQSFAVQRRMSSVNEVLADQADAVQALQLKMQALQQSGTMRDFQERLFKLGQEGFRVNRALAAKNMEISKTTEAVQRLKDQYKLLVDAMKEAIKWEGDPGQNMLRIIDMNEASGKITKGQARGMREDVNRAIDSAEKGRNTAAHWNDKKWSEIIWQGVKGLVTGDTWRKIGDATRAVPGLRDVPGLPGGIGMAGTALTIAAGIGGVTFLGAQLGRKMFNAALSHTAVGGFARNFAARMSSMLGTTSSFVGPNRWVGRGLGSWSNRWGRLATEGEFATRTPRLLQRNALGQLRPYRGGLFNAMRPLLSLRGALVGGMGAIPGAMLGNMLMPGLGGPLGGLLGQSLATGFVNRRYPNFFGLTRAAGGGLRAGTGAVSRTIGQRIYARMLGVSKGQLKAAERQNKAAAKQGRNATRGAKTAEINAKTSRKRTTADAKHARTQANINAKHREGLGKFRTRLDEVRKRFSSGASRIWNAGGRFGRGSRLFMGAAIMFKGATELFSGIWDKLKESKLGKMLGLADDAAKVGQAVKGPIGRAVSQAGRIGRGALRVGGGAFNVGMIASLVAGVARGDTGAIVGTAGGVAGAIRGGRAASGLARAVGDRGAARGAFIRGALKRFLGPAGVAWLGYDVAKWGANTINEGTHRAAHRDARYERSARYRRRHSRAPMVGEEGTGQGVRDAFGPEAERERLRRQRGLAGGIDRVHTDGVSAVLHQDEAVLQVAEANKWRRSRAKGVNDRADDTVQGKERYLRQLKEVDQLFRDTDDKDVEDRTVKRERLTKDYRDKEVKRREDHHRIDRRDTDDHGKRILKIIDEKTKSQVRTYDKGWNNIHGATKDWIKKIAKQVKGIDEDLGLTKGDTGDDTKKNRANGGIEAFMRGGLAKAGPIPKGRIVRVGEEGHDEVIIPLAPHRRNRAISLVQQTVGRLGGLRQDVQNFAAGGMTSGIDGAYLNARESYKRAKTSFASGGFTGPDGSGEGFNPISNFMRNKFNLLMTTGKDSHSYYSASGLVSDHTYGRAGDFNHPAGDGPAGEKRAGDAAKSFWTGPAKGLTKQLIWWGQAWPNQYSDPGHFDHVHLAVQDAFAFDAMRTAKALKRLSKGLSISDLLAAAGTGGPSMSAPSLKMPKGKDFKNTGPIGRRMLKLYKKKVKQWQKYIDKEYSKVASTVGGGTIGPGVGKPGKGRVGLDFFLKWAREGARKFSIAPSLLFSIAESESGFGENRGPSSAGAVGLMQFMPATAKGIGIDPYDDGQAIVGAAKYLNMGGGMRDLQSAVFSYNHAQWYVDKILAGAKRYKQYDTGFRNESWYKERNPKYAAGGFLGTFHEGVKRVPRDGWANLQKDEMVVAAKAARVARGESGGTKAPDKKSTRNGRDPDQRQRLWEERSEKLLITIQLIQEDIKKAERHLKNLTGKDDKEAQRKILADLNARLRERWGQQRRAQSRAASSLKGLLKGDRSGGEDTLAGVTAEQQTYRGILEEELAKWKERVEKARKAVKKAERRLNKTIKDIQDKPKLRKILKRGVAVRRKAVVQRERAERMRPTLKRVRGQIKRLQRGKETRQEKIRIRGLQKEGKQLARRIKRAVGQAGKGMKRSGKLIERGLKGVTKQGRKRFKEDLKSLLGADRRLRKVVAERPKAVARARARYVPDAARRGVNDRLIKDITGKALTRAQSQLYRRIEQQSRRGGTADANLVKRLRQSIIKGATKPKILEDVPGVLRQKARGARNLYVGDSMGEGTSRFMRRKGLDIDVRSGITSAQGLAKLKAGLKKAHKAVIFDLGTNDETAAQLKRSLTRAKRAVGGRKLVVPTLRGPDADAKNRVLREFARKHKGVSVVDWAKRSKKPGVSSQDKIHATPKGYKERAKMIERALKRVDNSVKKGADKTAKASGRAGTVTAKAARETTKRVERNAKGQNREIQKMGNKVSKEQRRAGSEIKKMGVKVSKEQQNAGRKISKNIEQSERQSGKRHTASSRQAEGHAKNLLSQAEKHSSKLSGEGKKHHGENIAKNAKHHGEQLREAEKRLGKADREHSVRHRARGSQTDKHNNDRKSDAQRTHQLLRSVENAINRKDLSVSINNTAIGATLTSQVSRGHRAR